MCVSYFNTSIHIFYVDLFFHENNGLFKIKMHIYFDLKVAFWRLFCRSEGTGTKGVLPDVYCSLSGAARMPGSLLNASQKRSGHGPSTLCDSVADDRARISSVCPGLERPWCCCVGMAGAESCKELGPCHESIGCSRTPAAVHMHVCEPGGSVEEYTPHAGCGFHLCAQGLGRWAGGRSGSSLNTVFSDLFQVAYYFGNKNAP